VLMKVNHSNFSRVYLMSFGCSYDEAQCMCLALSDGKVNMSHVHLKGNAKNEAKSLMSSIVTTCTLLSFLL